MKLKLIDLGNAVHVQQTHLYYDDFEVQSAHYRAPEVPFSNFDLIVGITGTTFRLCH